MLGILGKGYRGRDAFSGVCRSEAEWVGEERNKSETDNPTDACMIE